jgi:ribosomal-protein-alanine N-acetyltransferase
LILIIKLFSMNIQINDSVFESFPALETERLVLRDFTNEDASDFFRVRSNPAVMKYLDIEVHKTVADSIKMIERIHDSFSDKTGINWVIEEKGTKAFTGYCCFHRLMRANARAEIGYALRPEYWRKGIAKEAINALVNFAFNKLSVHGIEANVNPENISSKKLLGKLGFKREAFFREYHLSNKKFTDSEIYCLIESDVNS